MRQLRGGFAAHALQVDGGSGERDEARRAEMRDPAGGEECRPGEMRIDGIDGDVREEVARVWSSAMMTMSRSRRMSMDSRRRVRGSSGTGQSEGAERVAVDIEPS